MSKSEVHYNMEYNYKGPKGLESPQVKRGGQSHCQRLLGLMIALSLVYVAYLGFEAYLSPSCSKSEVLTSWPTPPPHSEVAKVARYVVHISDWASLATISTADPIKGYPFASIESVSDGPLGESSGIPYMYVTNLDLSMQDLMSDTRATLSMSEAQSDYCHTEGFDPEDPRCARVLISGSVVEVKNGTAEADFARNALFSRHPVMASWPMTDHHWFFVKLNITHIYLFDFFGGVKDIPVDEYFAAKPFL